MNIDRLVQDCVVRTMDVIVSVWVSPCVLVPNSICCGITHRDLAPTEFTKDEPKYTTFWDSIMETVVPVSYNFLHGSPFRKNKKERNPLAGFPDFSGNHGPVILSIIGYVFSAKSIMSLSTSVAKVPRSVINPST